MTPSPIETAYEFRIRTVGARRTRFNFSAPKGLMHMVEPATLKFVNNRIAELIQQCELGRDRPRRAILEELSELAVVRDELKKIQQRAADRPEQMSQSLPKEFPTLGALVHRVNRIAQEIAKTRKNDPHRPDLLNEITRLCLVAYSLYSNKEL